MNTDMRTMKIAFFTRHLPSDEPNGVSWQVHWLAQQLVRSGHKVVCHSFSPAPDDALYEHTLLNWNSKSALIRKFVPAFVFRTIDTSSFDIIHFHGDDYLCRGSDRRVRTFYGSALKEALHSGSVKRVFYQVLFYKFEWISCLRKGKKVGISEDTLKCLPLAQRVIPCCIPVEKYNPKSLKTPFPSILFVGTFYTRKRGELLMDAFQKQVLPLLPECRLRVVGPQACSGRNVDYLGRLDEASLIKEYSSAWVCCVCSSYEGFGVPVIEAMAGGAAVVATHNRGTDEIVTSSSDALVCTPSELGKTLLRVLIDYKLRDGLVKNGLKTAQRYSVEKVTNKYVELYVA